MKNNSRSKKLMEDLDRAAAELGMDAAALFAEYDKGNSKVEEAIRTMQEKGDSPEVRRMAQEGDLIRQEVHKKFIPLFEEMMRLGYTPDELMS